MYAPLQTGDGGPIIVPQVLSTKTFHQQSQQRPIAFKFIGDGDTEESNRTAIEEEEEEDTEAATIDDKKEEEEEEEAELGPIDQETPKYPKVYQDNIYMYNIIILLLGLAYSVVYIGQLFATRVLTGLIVRGYPRADLAPGAFLNDRVNYFAILLAICATRLPVVFTAVWMLRPSTKPIKRTINLFVTIFYIFVDVVVLLSLGVAWGLLCNTSTIGYAPCNAWPEDTCSVFGGFFTKRCMPPFLPPPTVPLAPTWAFYLLFSTIAAAFLLEIVLILVNTFLDDEAREYKRQLVFQRK